MSKTKAGDRTFRLHWKHNPEPEDVTGRDIAEAMTLAGYGRGAVAALDYWEEITPKAEPLTVGRIAEAITKANGDQVKLTLTVWAVRTETDEGHSHVVHIMAPDGTSLGILTDPDLADSGAHLEPLR